MSAFGVFLYTAAGGVVGSGLTQYVTHLRDRRTARAAIIKEIAAVEGEYVALAGNPEESPTAQGDPAPVEFNKALASLEAACLVAGVPRANVTTYVVSRRAGARVSAFRYAVTVANREAERRKKAIEAGSIDGSTARLDEALALSETLNTCLDELEGSCDSLTSIAYNELTRSVWNPFIGQLRKGNLHRAKKRISDLDANMKNAERTFKGVQVSVRKSENKRRKEMPSPSEPGQISPPIR